MINWHFRGEITLLETLCYHHVSSFACPVGDCISCSAISAQEVSGIPIVRRSEQNCTIFKLILTQSWLTLQNDIRVLYALPRANIACSRKYMGRLNCSIFVSPAEDCKIWCLSLDITPLFGAILVQMDVWNMVIKRHRLSSSKTPRYLIVCLLCGTVTVPPALSTFFLRRFHNHEVCFREVNWH